MSRQRTVHLTRRCARAFAAAALLVATTAASLLTSSTVHAETALLNCGGTAQQTWQPGITFAPKTVTYTASLNLTDCTGTTSITSGTISETAEATTSCTANAANTVPATIHWNDGTTSHITITIVGVGGGLTVHQFTGAGTVDSGRFAGATVAFTTLYSNLNLSQILACFNTGLTGLSGVVTSFTIGTA